MRKFILLSCSLVVLSTSCKKEEGVVSLRINDGTGQFISQLITTPSGAQGNIELWFGGGNFWTNMSTNGMDAAPEISDVGKVRNISKIDDIPTGGWAGLMSAQEKHGYVMRFKVLSGSYQYLKFYVEEAAAYGHATLQVKDPF